MRAARFPEEPKKGAPAFIVTFSDMITLLLTFFLMLLSMADEQCVTEKFQAGQTSFRQALAGFGMEGFMTSGSSGAQFNNPAIKYKVKHNSDETEDRTPETEMEMLARVIYDIERMMEILPSQITGNSNNFTVPDIRFEKGGWELNDAAKEYLSKYCHDTQEVFSNERPTIYIVGLAAKESDKNQQFMVSARRAQAVADFIKSKLPKDARWPVFCWGAGDGGDWAGKGAMISKEANIMIALLSQN